MDSEIKLGLLNLHDAFLNAALRASYILAGLPSACPALSNVVSSPTDAT